MEKGAKYFLFAVAALFGYSLWRKSEAGKKIETVFSKFRILKPSGFSLPVIQIIFDIQNPSSQQIAVNSLVGSIFVNGKYLANVTNFQKINVPANNQVQLPINVKVGIIDTIQNVIRLMQSHAGVKVTFKGNV